MHTGKQWLVRGLMTGMSTVSILFNYFVLLMCACETVCLAWHVSVHIFEA